MSLVLGLCFQSATAQGWLRSYGKKTVRQALETPSIKSSQLIISEQLRRRAIRSFEKAKQAQQLASVAKEATLFSPPVKHIPSKIEAGIIYPQQTFLTTPDQVANYMVARNNRLAILELKRIEKLLGQIEHNLPALKMQAQNTPQPPNPISWLSTQIPNDTTLICVGEVHGFVEIRQAFSDFLTYFRQQHPQKEIILLTEFLPEHVRWPASNEVLSPASQRYEKTWKSIESLNIPIIGLEPDFVKKTQSQARILNKRGKMSSLGQWAVGEGVRIRNQKWLETISYYRQQHPDALLVVYSGAGHTLYHAPFSLTHDLPLEKPFVVALFPDKYPTITGDGFLGIAQETSVKLPGPLERLTQPLNFDFPQTTVLQFDTKLSKLAGFDISIRLSVDPERYFLENEL